MNMASHRAMLNSVTCGVPLDDVVTITLEACRAHILERASDPINEEDLSMSKQISSTLELIAKEKKRIARAKAKGAL